MLANWRVISRSGWLLDPLIPSIVSLRLALFDTDAAGVTVALASELRTSYMQRCCTPHTKLLVRVEVGKNYILGFPRVSFE